MTTQDKDKVIEVLIERFVLKGNRATYGDLEILADETRLIRASCENIYQAGYLQGKYEALEGMLKEFKGEEVSHG